MLVALIPLCPAVGLSARAELLVRLLLPAAALAWAWRALPPIRVRWPLSSILVGVGVCAVWIAPDALIPGWRGHWLLQNSLMGRLSIAGSRYSLQAPFDLALRTLRACTVVALAEELFWRGWFMRWLIREDFSSLPVGAWQLRAFLLTAVLFALEHGSYWEVGLAAGLLYNWWAVRTRSLGDVVLAHAVTNALLAVFVIATRHWEYWM